MPDITMCKDHDCNLKETCFRYNAKPDYYQSYFVGSTKDEDGKCDYFWISKVLQSPYPEEDLKTLWWDVALSIGKDPVKFIQDNIKSQNKKFDAKQHWRDTFGTEPTEDVEQWLSYIRTLKNSKDED